MTKTNQENNYFIKKRGGIVLFVMIICFIAACGGSDGSNGRSGANVSIQTTTLNVDDKNCPNGGIRIDVFVDGIVQPEQVQYICNGSNGAPGESGSSGQSGVNGSSGSRIQTTALAAGDAHCPNGGAKIEVLQDGTIRPEQTQYICNGAPGPQGETGAQGPQGEQGIQGETGAPGEDGEDGVAISNATIQTEALETGDAHCPNGGVKIEIVIEGVVDESQSKYLCHGAQGETGASGTNATIQTTALPAGDTNCQTGGMRIDILLNGVPQTEQTQYICNGEQGLQGIQGETGATGAQGEAGENGSHSSIQTTALAVGDAHCPNGGVKIDVFMGGELQAGQTQYICHGADGEIIESSGDASIRTTALETGDENCPNGGIRIEILIDGIVQPAQTQYVCHSMSGHAGSNSEKGHIVLSDNAVIDFDNNKPIYYYNKYYIGVRLSRAPTADVLIPVVQKATTTTVCDHLLFTPDNWNVEQDIVYSSECHPNLLGPADSNDVLFHGVTRELPSVTSGSYLALSKQDLIYLSSSNCYGTIQDSFDVELKFLPATEVVVSLRLKDPAAGTLSANELIFTPNNWDIPQTVTVTGTPGAQKISTRVDLEVINEAVARNISIQGHSTTIDVHVCGATQFYHVGYGACVDADKAALAIQEDGSCAPIPPEFVTIPAGTFHSSVPDAENPVSLESFKIARTETTVRQYAGCIAAGACTDDHYYKYLYSNTSMEGKCNYGQSDYWLNHPMNCVSQTGAEAYCAWIGGRLPTEDEWQYAATHDGTQALETIYPWGDEAPTSEHANYASSFTTPVGTYSPKGDSPLGLQDMAGNVWEWTSSRYYPSDSGYKVYKGGSWYHSASYLPVSYRDYGFGSRSYYIGFRCVAPSR